MKPIEELKVDLSPGIKEYVDRIDGYKRMMSDLVGMPKEITKPMANKKVYGNRWFRVERYDDACFSMKPSSHEWSRKAYSRWAIWAFGKCLLIGIIDGKPREFGWIRFGGSMGPGFKWRDVTRTEATFSERNGHERRLVIGKWSIGFLPKE